MGDDRHHRLRLRAVYASRSRARLQVLDVLEAIGKVGEPEVGNLGFGGFVALAGPLHRAAWPPRFKPDIGACYDGTSDSKVTICPLMYIVIPENLSQRGAQR
jgi:hypothetical protein